MNAQTGIPGGGFPFSADFLKVWLDQAGSLGTATLTGPWKALLDLAGTGPNFAGTGPDLAGAGPALGLSREYQEIAARLLDLGRQFQLRSAELMQQSGAVTQDALQIMKQRIESDPSLLKSPPDLYDAWIDCAESCYAQAARSDAFANLFAEICNLASAIKVERGKLVEQVARQLDLPSRAEVDTLNRQVRLLSAALKAAAVRPPKKPAARARKRRGRSRP
jgi:class III poly(R)-hydroxyalkanoic acid synthase PhaE subunit